MKRLFPVLLALILALGLATPALAEALMQDELTAITERVVGVLDVGEDYTDFTGNYYDGLRPGWNLYWSKDGEDLSVQCTADGLITEVYHWRYQDGGDRFYGYDAAFPQIQETAARRQAESWLRRLMGESERARIDRTAVTLTENGEYSFSGHVLLKGRESPITFSLNIGADGLTSYSRSDSYKGYIGGVPDTKCGVGKERAAALLKDAAALELYYVTDGEEARLRYVPVGPTTIVDAQTGEAVDMDALYASFGGSYPAPEAPAAEMSMDAAAGVMNGRGLTEVELSSIENYADALPQDELDAAARSIGDLGLADFTLTRCSYNMDSEGSITASLRYTCEMTADNLFGYSLDSYWDYLDWGETPTATKYISVDAKTGALISVSTSYSLWEKDGAKSADVSAADRFLAAAAPEMDAESALCTLKGYNEGVDSFTYARMHEGYFFPENYLYVELNPATGTVDTYYYAWDEDAVFAPATGIVGESEALDAYTDALTVTLGYSAWPEAIDFDDPVLYAYLDWGYSYVESLRLAFYYSGTDGVSGVDALTGEPIRQDPDGGYVYDDLDGVTEREAIEALAEAGIGLPGTSFRPADTLTMRDAARLLLSSAGYDVSDWDDEALQSEAAWQGFVPAADWEPDREVTKAEFTKMLLAATRYGDAAALPGIGFETVARALGMIADTIPEGSCTRADAAALLYAFMKR